MGCEWASSITVSVFDRGTTNKGFSSPLSWRDTVKQAFLDDEVWDRVGAWQDLFPLNQPHLSPTVLQPVVLMLGFAEVAPS